MASTYSTNLRLELIGTGEQQGTWGSTTNTNLGTLLEQAITGYTSVTVADAGDTTLTTANGATDQARNMTINLTGALTASRNVICPSTPKIYIVRNSTTGGFSVVFKVSGQTGVTIAPSQTVLIYVNGTDAQQATGSIASGGTGAGTANSGLGNLTTYATTATAAGTTTLTVTSAHYQFFTGSTTQTVVLPVASTLTTGYSFRIVNNSTGNLTVNSSGSNLVATVLPGTMQLVTCILASGTTAASWSAEIDGITTATGTGSMVLGTAPTISNANLTGVPVAPTATANTSNTQVATTAYVMTMLNSTAGTIAMNGTQAAGTSNLVARADHVHPSDTAKANIASPTFTGVPNSTNASAYTNTAQIATTNQVYVTVTSVPEVAYSSNATLALTDAGKMVTMSNATGATISVPTNASVAFPVGTRIDLVSIGTGQTSIAASNAVVTTISSSGSKLKLTGQYSGATLWKKATDTWYLIGDITA